MKINELKENVLNEIFLLVSSVEFKKTKKDEDYARVTFSDGTSKIGAFIWNIKKDNFALSVGNVYQTYAYKQEFNSKPVLKIVETIKCEDETICQQFFKSAPIAKEEIKTFIDQQVETIADKTLKKLTQNILNQYQDKYYRSAAAANNHHAYNGGMSYHVYNMLKLVELFEHNLFNRDVLISALVLHDIGKCFELDSGIVVTYTTAGNLLGHLAIGFEIVYSYAQKENLYNENVKNVLDLILSHHGKIEYGNLKECVTIEEKMINLIDTIDAYLNAFIEKLEEISLKSWSDNVFALNNRKVYKHEKIQTTLNEGQVPTLVKDFVEIYKKRYNEIDENLIYLCDKYYLSDFVSSYELLLSDEQNFEHQKTDFRFLKHMLIANNMINDQQPMYAKLVEAEMYKWILKIKNFDYEG